MKLVKTAFFSAIITFIRIISGFVASKFVAVITGPAGVALIGAFSNFISIILTFANGAINTGVIKYTAEYDGDNNKLKSLFSTALKITLYSSLIVGILILIFARYCSVWIFTSTLYTYAIHILGFTLILYSLNSLLISILNGKKEIKIYTIVNTAGSIIGLLFTIILVYFFKIVGALYALVLAQSIVFFVTLTMVIKRAWFSWSYFNGPFDKGIAKQLGGFSLMAIITALTSPVSQIILRNMVAQREGLIAAGYWQGMMRVSDGYLLIITTSLSTYYLPKLSALKENLELRKEIFLGYKIILPTVFVGCLMIYFFRILIIRILYTNTFLLMENLFVWQLIGDFFKIASWILAYLMLAKALTKLYIVCEIVFSISYVVLGYLLVGHYHLRGITIAFAINYIIFFIVMVITFRKILFGRQYNE